MPVIRLRIASVPASAWVKERMDVAISALHSQPSHEKDIRALYFRRRNMTTPPPGSVSIDELLEEARSHLTRITPEEVFTELRQGHEPVLVDIRPAAQRAAEGSIDGALIIERNVLEWRFDPRCSARLPIATRYDLRVVVLCQEGYTSSLAARALQQLGLHKATDVVGGFRAWREAGLPEKI